MCSSVGKKLQGLTLAVCWKVFHQSAMLKLKPGGHIISYYANQQENHGSLVFSCLKMYSLENDVWFSASKEWSFTKVVLIAKWFYFWLFTHYLPTPQFTASSFSEANGWKENNNVQLMDDLESIRSGHINTDQMCTTSVKKQQYHLCCWLSCEWLTASNSNWSSHCPVAHLFPPLTTITSDNLAEIQSALHKCLQITFCSKLSHDSNPVLVTQSFVWLSYPVKLRAQVQRLVLPVVTVIWIALTGSHCCFSGIHWFIVVYFS